LAIFGIKREIADDDDDDDDDDSIKRFAPVSTAGQRKGKKAPNRTAQPVGMRRRVHEWEKNK
jgi:hypothetical protein